MSREIIRKYRLSPTELNGLIRKLASNYNADLASLEINKQSVVNVKGREFIIFPMCKDAQTEENESGLPYIGNVLRDFSDKNRDRDCTLLIPMRMCRGYLKAPTSITYLKRKHAVLVEVDFTNKHIEVHDSQGKFRHIFYPDKLIEIANMLEFNYNSAKHYHAYGVQENLFFSDVVSCGYYVFSYLSHILATGNAQGCDKISLNIIQEYSDKNEFLKKHDIHFSGLEAIEDDSDEDFLEFEINENKELLAFEIGPENELKVDQDKIENKEAEEKKESALLGQGFFSIVNTDENKSRALALVPISEVKFKFM